MTPSEEAQLLSFALNSPKRVVSFSEVSAVLNIPLQAVAFLMVEVIAKGTILGRIDAESSQLVINGTVISSVTPDLVNQSIDGLRQIEKQLDDDLRLSRTAHKRHHSSV